MTQMLYGALALGAWSVCLTTALEAGPPTRHPRWGAGVGPQRQ
jgi:hypothetical protein